MPATEASRARPLTLKTSYDPLAFSTALSSA